jgi:photosystem II S4 domain protein
MLPREDLLKNAAYRDCLARVIDRANDAIRTWEIICTEFLSPPELAEVQRVFARLTDVTIVAWGGYPQAERQRCAIARSEVPIDTSHVDLTVLEVAGNFLFDTATHRDFLGSMLGTGIVREKTGDVLVLGDRGAQVIVASDIAEFLELSLVQVRSVPVKTRAIEASELKVQPPKVKEMTTVEASMRLDAVASAGFGMSRSKMAGLISSGDVRVNWKEISQSSYTVKAGDLVAIRGKGRLEIGEVSITKKDRYRVQLTRFY